MSNWLFNNKKEPPENIALGQLVTGSFECTSCGIIVGEARLNSETGTLTWKCPDGHSSMIKEFI